MSRVETGTNVRRCKGLIGEIVSESFLTFGSNHRWKLRTMRVQKDSGGAYLVLMVGTSRPPAPPPIPVTARVSRLARREPGLELPSLNALDTAMTS